MLCDCVFDNIRRFSGWDVSTGSIVAIGKLGWKTTGDFVGFKILQMVDDPVGWTKVLETKTDLLAAVGNGSIKLKLGLYFLCNLTRKTASQNGGIVTACAMRTMLHSEVNEMRGKLVRWS